MIASHVEHIRRRDRRAWKAAPRHWRVPFRSARGEEVVHRRWHSVGQRAERGLEESLPSLQRVEHGEAGQDGVFGLPRLGCAPRTKYSIGAAVEAGQPRIDAVGIGSEDRAIRRRRLRYGFTADVPEPVHARRAIDLERAFPHERAQLARGLTTLQVHLKETVLRVEKPERPRRVAARRRGDGGHAKRVAVDAHRRLEASHRNRSGLYRRLAWSWRRT